MVPSDSRKLSKYTDVTLAPQLQSEFRSFYQVRRDSTWQRSFFALMQQQRDSPLGFKGTLLSLAQSVGQCEASFASKLTATLDPQSPVIDSRVMAVLRMHLPNRAPQSGGWRLLRTGPLDHRIQNALALYECLVDTVRCISRAPSFDALVARFDRKFPEASLTTAKKIDLILWRYGATLDGS